MQFKFEDGVLEFSGQVSEGQVRNIMEIVMGDEERPRPIVRQPQGDARRVIRRGKSTAGLTNQIKTYLANNPGSMSGDIKNALKAFEGTAVERTLFNLKKQGAIVAEGPRRWYKYSLKPEA